MLNNSNISLDWARTRQIELTVERDNSLSSRRIIDTPKRLPKIRTNRS